MKPSEGQFESQEDRNVREFGHYNVEMFDGKSVLRRPGTKGTEGILPRDIPMSGRGIAKWRAQRGER